MSARCIGDLDRRLGRFADASDRPIGKVTRKEIQDWLVRWKLAPRGRKNCRNHIVLLLNFARLHSDLAGSQETQAEGPTEAKTKESDIGIFAPDNLSPLLTHADESLRHCHDDPGDQDREDWHRARHSFVGLAPS